ASDESSAHRLPDETEDHKRSRHTEKPGWRIRQRRQGGWCFSGCRRSLRATGKFSLFFRIQQAADLFSHHSSGKRHTNRFPFLCSGKQRRPMFSRSIERQGKFQGRKDLCSLRTRLASFL